MADNVNSPSHYAEHCSIECIDAIRLILGEEGFEAFCKGNVIKYLWRHKFKNGQEDLQKAGWYLERVNKDYDFLKDMIDKLSWKEEIEF